MAESILLRFLRGGLIDVNGDDAKLDKISLAAGELAGELRKSPSKAVAYVLAAVDPEVHAEDPAIVEALDALNKHWVTYVNTFSGTPVAVARAIILDALVQAAVDNVSVGAAFVALARNAFSVSEPSRDTAVWADVIMEIERDVNARAEAEWAVPSSISAPVANLKIPDPTPLTITADPTDVDHLKTEFYAAAGPQYVPPQQGQTLASNGNPHWAHSNPQHWAGEFGDRMAASVAEALDAAVNGVTVANADLSEPIQSLATGVSEYIAEAITAVTAATTGLQRRVALVWWKESLFSPTCRVSYRDLPPASAATLMAFDLHQQVPASSPASVVAFLAETVMSLPLVETERTYAVNDLVELSQNEEALDTARGVGALLTAAPEGRGPVIALIAHCDVAASRDRGAFRRLTGVPDDARLTLAQWACWVFRELQATSATAASKASRSRRRSRG
ncbi:MULTISPECIES: GTPase-associated system all-helical protein GASH [Streptomyces]|uniref:GTPase-associated system all-helical protein GASH n=1 Tax=Streptomyces TaxID=1883 RepID=UPI001D196804|nr:GTPase-associated system all-helical protein GASH [Streptomyces anulatus]